MGRTHPNQLRLTPSTSDWIQGRWRRTLGLRFRLLLLVLVALLPAFGIALYTGYRERQVAEHHAEHHALELTVQVADQQHRLVKDSQAVLRVLGAAPPATRAAGVCQSPQWRSALAAPHLEAIGVADGDGRVLCQASASGHHQKGMPDSSDLRTVLARKGTSASGVSVERLGDRSALVVARPMRRGAGESGRVLFAVLRLDWVKALVARAHLPTGAVFSLFGADGRGLVRYSDADAPAAGGSPTAAMLKRRIGDHRAWAGTVEVHGTRWLVTDARLGDGAAGQGIHAAVALPAAATYAAADRLLDRDLVVLGALGLASLVLAWLVGDRLVVRPLRHLVGAAEQIARGDLHARTDLLAGPAELVSLGGAFDRMAASLEARIRQSELQSQRIDRLNRIYQVLSAVNGAIIRLHDRGQLLQEACRIAVELGCFPFAWIGLIDSDGTTVRIVGHAGGADDFVQNVRVTLNPDEPEGRGIMGEALRTGRRAIANDAQGDPRLAARRDEFRRLNVQSAAAFPLRVQDRVVGAFALHAEEPGFFDAEEITLLDEVAADTSLGLEQIEKDRQLNYLAYWDALTNLPNRQLFEDRLGQSLRRAERSGMGVVVLAVDITDFGRINDTEGRSVGDRLLQSVAMRLTTVVRESESLGDLGSAAARLASHEFALVMDDVSDLAGVDKVVERIRAALATPIPLEEGEIPITVRIGAAAYPQDGAEPEELLHKAQFAAHSQSDDQRIPFVYYSPEIDTASRARYALEMDLHHATENEAFHLEYQPRLHARTGRIIGAEALLRWDRPGYGRVPPDQFIPVLEKTGLIDQVGEWVARTAFAQRLAWRDVVPEDFVMAVNASSHELRTPDYVSRIGRLIKAVGVRPAWTEIEITESGLMETGNATLELLSGLKALGVRLSIDDFGTGYSSLSYLRQFPVDTLKVDQSFVRDISHSGEALCIVQSILALARALRLTVVAEGVETGEQLRLLVEEGCDEIQGYYFSRPVAPEAFADMVRSRATVRSNMDLKATAAASDSR